ncbi:MAG: glycosyltransferase family 4 protein [Pirellulales bacterium]|nr:glycosyltransferase family 4 protein [Pirellulales bacterium]
MSGVQRSMLETLRHLDRNTFEPHVVCQSTGPLTDELKRYDIPCHLIPELGRPIRPWKDIRAFYALKRLFRRQRFQLVHNQSAKPRAIASFAARQAGVPIVINHIRGYPFHSQTRPLIAAAYRRIEAQVASICDRTIFVNYEDRQLAIDMRLAPETRCLTIYNGTDLNLLSPSINGNSGKHFRHSFGLGDDVIISFLGRLDNQKHPLSLPTIAAELDARSIEHPWKIVVAGEGPLQGALEKAIAKAGVSHRIHIVGWQSSPINLLHATDILLLPSLWEGLPRVLIEAHAAGVPCVASNISGNREVVTEETGRLVDPKDASVFADALALLIDNPFLRKKMGLAARRRAEQLFDTVENNRQIIALYCDLLDLPAPAMVPAARAA